MDMSARSLLSNTYGVRCDDEILKFKYGGINALCVVTQLMVSRTHIDGRVKEYNQRAQWVNVGVKTQRNSLTKPLKFVSVQKENPPNLCESGIVTICDAGT